MPSKLVLYGPANGSSGGMVGAYGAPALLAAQGVGVVNVANLASVLATAPTPGYTYVHGDRILLANQTTLADNGLYIWSDPNATGTGSLSRAPEMATGTRIRDFTTVTTGGAGSVGIPYTPWKLALGVGQPNTFTTDGFFGIVGTTNLSFWPMEQVVGGGPLVNGVFTISTGIWLRTTTRQRISVTRTVGGHAATSYLAVTAGSVVAGVPGTAAFEVSARDTAGALNAADASSVFGAIILNW